LACGAIDDAIFEIVPDESLLGSDGKLGTLPFRMVRTVAPDVSWNTIGEASGRDRIGPRGLHITLDEKSKLRELLGEFCNRVCSGSRCSRSS